MRWTALFDDFEAQLEAAEAAQDQVRVSELSRVETSQIELVDRLRAGRGTDVRLRLQNGRDVVGRIEQVARQWVLLRVLNSDVLLPISAIDVVHNLGTGAADERSRVLARLGLGHTLRALARDRVVVRVGLRSGDLVGRIERVGRDHFDLNPRAADPESGQRAQSGRSGASGAPGGGAELILIPFTALLSVGERS